MKSSDTKKLLHWGWVTGEKRMLRELEKQAEEGWILDRCTNYHLILKKDIPRKIQYAVDWPQVTKSGEAEYLEYFKETGWKLSCKNGCFYIFYAEEGASPIHTDRSLLSRLRKQRLKMMIPRAVICLVLAAGFVLLGRQPQVPFALRLLCLPFAVISAGFLGIYATTIAALLRIRNNF